MEECTVYWNDQVLQKEQKADAAGEITRPSVSISKDQTGFIYVLARPAGADRIVALTLDSNPEPGVYEFRPFYNEFEFTVRLEYQDEPYPEPRMHILDVTTPLSAVEVGDQIEIGLRKDQTNSPGTKPLQGHVAQIMDFSGLVPDLPAYYPDPATVLSILVSLSDEAPSNDTITASKLMGQTRLPPIGESFGTLDVVGSNHPLDLQWEGKSDTPALQVEFVRVNPGQESELTVENESLPETQFDDLADHSQNERISILESALSKSLDRPIADETLEFFATAVDELPRDRTLTVHYDSSRSENTLTKSGTFVGTDSVYYAEENRARHHLRFSGSDGRFYILLDSDDDATTPARVFSTSLARHWDTDLGPLVGFELSE
jgi:hypothetical protein